MELALDLQNFMFLGPLRVSAVSYTHLDVYKRQLRTIVQELIDYQLNDYPEDAIAQKQRELNVAYDRFADQYGLSLIHI